MITGLFILFHSLFVGSFFNMSAQAQNPAETTAASPNPETQVPKSPLRLRLTADPETFDWNKASTSHETYSMVNIMEGLLEHDEALNLKPALAESWSVSADGKVYTFKLRKKVKWSDGHDLTAGHFQASWIRLLSPSLKSNNASLLFAIKNARKYYEGTISDASQVGIEVIDKETIKVTLEDLVPFFDQAFTFWATFPIRPDLVQQFGRNWSKPDKLVVLGPYRITKHEEGQFIAFRPNRNYWRYDNQIPHHVIATIEPDDKKTSEQFFSEHLDMLLSVTTEDLLRQKKMKEKGFQLQRSPYLATYYLGFNTKSALMRDLNLRKAVASVLDKAKIPGLLQGGQIPAKGWIPPLIPGHGMDNAPKATIYEARGALVKAGYREGRGLAKLSLLMERFDGADALAQHIVETLKEKLGIEMFYRIEDPQTYNKIRSEAKADMFLGHWGADFVDPANFMDVFAGDASSNHTGWSNKEYDRLINEARTIKDMKKRLQLYGQAERILIKDDIVIVPLFYPQHVVMKSDRISGLRISPLNYLFFKDIRVLH